MITHPELVGGTGRTCTALISACEGRAVVKVGAEGVYAAILPGAGLGVALKIDDGSTPAAEILLTELLKSLGCMRADNPADDIPGPSPSERAAVAPEILELKLANLGPL
jgi:L-asparaginase II